MASNIVRTWCWHSRTCGLSIVTALVPTNKTKHSLIVHFKYSFLQIIIILKKSVQQEEDKEKIDSNDIYTSSPFFTFPKNSGIFVPFSKLRPVIPSSSARAQQEPVKLSAGDRVTYFITNECRHGMVLGVKEKSGQTLVQISTVSK